MSPRRTHSMLHFSLSTVFLCVFLLSSTFGQESRPWSCRPPNGVAHSVIVCTGGTQDTLIKAMAEVSFGTTNLTLLDGEVQRLQSGVFNHKNLASILFLRIGPNGIKDIDDHAFLGLQNIQCLFVDGNPIYSLPRNSFRTRDFPELKEIRFNRNDVMSIESLDFAGADRLEILDLNNNRIEFIQGESFRDCSSLRELYLSKNWMMSISKGTFYGLRSLITIDISHNLQVFDTVYVSATPFQFLAKCEYLNLANTSRHGVLPDTLLSGLVRLRHLNLSLCQLASFPSKILSMADTNLTSLDLSHNSLPEVTPLQFRAHSKLEELYFSYTGTRIVQEGVWWHLKSLRTLDLSGNRHLVIDGGLRGLTRLSFLNLRDVALSSVPDTFFNGLENVREINLADNNLTHVTTTALEPIPTARIIFDRNPWECDCSMLPIKLWILQSKLNFNITCSAPLEVRGQRLEHVKNSSLCRVPYIKDCCFKRVEGYEGRDVTITCTAWGDPKPIVTYSVLGGNPLPENRTVFTQDNQTVVIHELTPENYGNFTCTAHNEMGESTMFFELDVFQTSLVQYAEIIAITCVAGIVFFSIIWLLCFLVFKQRYFVYKPYVEDESDEHGHVGYGSVQVRL